MPGILNEIFEASNKEEVVNQDSLAFAQLLLCAVEVKLDVQILNERGDRVTVGI